MVQARFPAGTQRVLLPLLIREVTGAPFLMKANVKWTLETSTPVSTEWTIRPIQKKRKKEKKKKKKKENTVLFLNWFVYCKNLSTTTKSLIFAGLITSNRDLLGTLKLPILGSEWISSPSAYAILWQGFTLTWFTGKVQWSIPKLKLSSTESKKAGTLMQSPWFLVQFGCSGTVTVNHSCQKLTFA